MAIGWVVLCDSWTSSDGGRTWVWSSAVLTGERAIEEMERPAAPPPKIPYEPITISGESDTNTH